MQACRSLTRSAAGVALLLAAAWGSMGAATAHAEDGSAAWLRYAPIPDAARYARCALAHRRRWTDSPSD